MEKITRSEEEKRSTRRSSKNRRTAGEPRRTRSSSRRIKEEPQYEYSGLSFVKTALVLAVLAAGTAGTVLYMKNNKPTAAKVEKPRAVLSVAAEQPSIQNYPIKLSANGTISAATRGLLTSEVSGQIIRLSKNFNNGGTFNKGEVLASVDARNFSAGVTSANSGITAAQAQASQARSAQVSAESSMSAAESSILAAQSEYDRELARSQQAKRDWERLGYTGEPNDLVLRKQQLSAALAKLDAARALKESASAERQVAISQEQSANAQIESAKASLSRAQLDSSRTKIRAPYSGTVISRSVELGQYVNPGSALGEIFANKGLEVLLPLNQNQFAELNLQSKPKVILTSQQGGQTHQWVAEITRADSVFDTTTRQLNVTATVANPLSDKGAKLIVGQYVNAVIQGRVAQNVIVIPSKAIREGKYVLTLENGVLRRKDIKVIWQDADQAIIEGLTPESMVVTTSISGASNGAPARLITKKLPTKE